MGNTSDYGCACSTELQVIQFENHLEAYTSEENDLLTYKITTDNDRKIIAGTKIGDHEQKDVVHLAQTTFSNITLGN